MVSRAPVKQKRSAALQKRMREYTSIAPERRDFPGLGLRDLPTPSALGLRDLPTLRFSDFETEERLAFGAYGIVYAARERGGQKRAVAIKRNISTWDCLGICVLREADHLTRVVGHPHVVDIAGVIVTNGSQKMFNEPASHVQGFSRDNRDDSVHFVFAMEKTDLSEAIRSSPLDPNVFKIVAMQILLGVEWMHSRGVAHRDIKPSNILFNRSSSNPQIRLCDFGLSGIVPGTDMRSPGLVTNWYRPPEITLGRDYGANVDIWSIAVVFIQLMSRKVLVKTSEEDKAELLVKLLEKIPEVTSLQTFEMLAGDAAAHLRKKVIGALSPESLRVVESPVEGEERALMLKARIRKFLGLTVTAVQNFNAAPAAGNLDELCDLIARMLSFDPARRPSASECLDHPFFAKLRERIHTMRLTYLAGMPAALEGRVPATIASHDVVIRNSASRRLVCRTLAEIWWRRADIRWYDHRIIFHVIDTFDRFFEHTYDPRAGDEALTAPLTRRDKRQLFLQIYTLLYTYHKYFTTLQKLEDWRDFAPVGYGSSGARREAEDFEAFVVESVCRFQVYRATVFEVLVARSHGEIHENDVRNCLAGLAAKAPAFWVGPVDRLLDDALGGFGEGLAALAGGESP